MKSKALPCPFCGSQPHLKYDMQRKKPVYELVCDDPFCTINPRTMTCFSQAGCFELWNRRKKP